MIESTRSSATPAKKRRAGDRRSPLPYEKGNGYGPLEHLLKARGHAGTLDSAHSLIRDLPPLYADFLRCIVEVDPDRLAVINREPEAVLEGCDADAAVSVELLIEEAERDGVQDLTFETYRNTPPGPERDRARRAAAHACYRHGRVLMRLGRALERPEAHTT